MGETNPVKSAAFRRRRNRMWWLCFAAVGPYALFVLAMIVSPESLAVRPLGGSVSLAILTSVSLYVWSVIVAIIYVRGADSEEGRT